MLGVTDWPALSESSLEDQEGQTYHNWDAFSTLRITQPTQMEAKDTYMDHSYHTGGHVQSDDSPEGGDKSDEGGSEKSAPASEPQSHSGSLFLEAAEKGDMSTMKAVMGGDGFDVDKKTRYQSRGALHLACGYGQYDVVQHLLQVHLCLDLF